jgi:LmbE family N-acetylglucosaminyl deacetylase
MNVLAFFAHPDDETILAGGTLAMLAENGSRVHCLSATRGEGGELGETPLCSEDELGQVRESEMVCEVGAQGRRSLTFLGYQDPRMGEDESSILMRKCL